MRQRIRDARLARDLTQEQLAEEANVSSASVIRAERGDPISPLVQARIARALGRRRQTLFPEPEPEEASA